MTTEDIDRLVEALRQDPEARRTLLRAMLTEDLLLLPERLAEADARLAALAVQVAEMDARLTARLDTLTARLDTLAGRVEALAGRVEALAGRVEALAGRVEALAARLEALAAKVEALATQLGELIGVVKRHDDQLGDLRGWRIEERYRTHGDALLSSLARRLALVSRTELMELVEDAQDAGVLTSEEATDVRLADAVFRGRIQGGETAYLVVEASAGIGAGDVARARRRAGLLARTGTPALAVVGGERIDPDSAALARAAGVHVLVDGGRRP